MPQKKEETPQLNQVLKIRKRLKNFAEMSQKYWEIPQKYWEIPQKKLSGEKWKPLKNFRKRLKIKRKRLKIWVLRDFRFSCRNCGNVSKKTVFEGFPLFLRHFRVERRFGAEAFP